MRGKLTLVALVFAVTHGATAADQAEDAKAIAGLNAAFAKAFNAGDPAALGALFADDATLTDAAGQTVNGRKAIEAQFVAIFRTAPGVTVELKTDSLRFVTPDVALEEGTAVVKSPGDDAGVSAPFTSVYVRGKQGWLHASVRDHPAAATEEAAPAKPADQLKELEWMLGDWVEEGKDEQFTSTCRRGPGGSFLVWEYKTSAEGANATSGTSYIGWDPLTQQIRSWVFDADGGHGEATWTRYNDDQWVVKAAGVLGDGATATATQYVTRLGPDRASWTSLDRVAGGMVMPDVAEYILARRAPAPGGQPAVSPKPGR